MYTYICLYHMYIYICINIHMTYGYVWMMRTMMLTFSNYENNDVNTFKISLLFVRSLVSRVYFCLSPFEVDHS